MYGNSINPYSQKLIYDVIYCRHLKM